MGIFDSEKPDDKVMGSYILSEIRDLRRGMEGRDGELRGEIAAVRDAVSTLSESVTRSHHKVDDIKSDVDAIAADVHKLREDVDHIQHSTNLDKIVRSSSWDGPKKVIGVLALLGTGAGALITLKAVWPWILTVISL